VARLRRRIAARKFQAAAPQHGGVLLLIRVVMSKHVFAKHLSWWCEPLPLEMISMPLKDSAMCGARGVNSSSHVSAASVVSENDSAASPVNSNHVGLS